MQKLLVATKNKGKLKELNILFKEMSVEIISLEEVEKSGEAFDVEEPAMTMEGNAIIKAMTYGNHYGLLTLADDSGLEIDALGGAPGVFSARYAKGSDKDRYEKILEELKNVPVEKRSARFRSTMCIYNPDNKKVRTCEGVCSGVITKEPVGENGFGYDPVFLNKELGKTNAEMSLEEKNLYSHRAKALIKAVEILEIDFS